MIKAKAIHPYTSFSAFKRGIFRQEMHAAALDIMVSMLKDYEKTVRTWEHEVDFKGEVNDKPAQISVSVSTDDEIYGYVDKGTKPHIIRPKKKNKSGRLFFQSKYKSKTTPRVISSRKGGSSGDTVVAKAVHHPGTDAREFTHTIQGRFQPKLKKEMEKAITRAAKKSGHSATK